MNHRSNDEAMAETYTREPELAAQVLNHILDDAESTQGEILTVLRQLAIAEGGVQAVARKAGLNPTQLYRTLSKDGNPELRSFMAILKNLGLQLNVKRIEPSATARRLPAKVARKRTAA